MRLLLFIIILLFFLKPFYGLCQKNVEIKDNHGVINITVEEFNKKYKDVALNVSKYIDTTKQIWVIVGNSPTFIYYPWLRQGHVLYPFGGGENPSAFIIRGGENILSIKMIKGIIKISSNIIGFDAKYIAKIIDNKLIPSVNIFHLYVSDSYFELFDQFDIPVLQIELIKKLNAIYIGGAFNDDFGYTIISKEKGMDSRHFPKTISLMTQSEKDSIFYYYRTEAKKNIKPVHD